MLKDLETHVLIIKRIYYKTGSKSIRIIDETNAKQKITKNNLKAPKENFESS